MIARKDERLEARILETTELWYRDQAPPELDRAPFVRAASGLAYLGDRIVIAQDDAAFLGVREADGTVRSIALPPIEGRRRFEARLGNKAHKLDLESCATLPDGRVLAIGSGSTPRRETIAILDAQESLTMFHARELYASLRRTHDFSGSELNIEGATYIDGYLRLFQRGNGAPNDEHPAVNATVDLAIDALAGYFAGGSPPALENIHRFELGRDGDVRYGFTDAAAFGDRVLYLAGAESSPNTYDDGEVLGAHVGVIDGDGARYAQLCDRDGAPAIVKAEGLLPWRDRPDRAWVALDPDDPDRPAVLCEVALEGPW